MSEPRPARSLWEQALPASSSSPADIPKTPRIEITRKRQTCLLRFLPNSMEYAAIRSMDKHISKHLETKHLAADVVHYREYKILLQPDRFTSKNGFLEFWETASKTLKKLGLKVDVDSTHSTVRFGRCSSMTPRSLTSTTTTSFCESGLFTTRDGPVRATSWPSNTGPRSSRTPQPLTCVRNWVVTTR